MREQRSAPAVAAKPVRPAQKTVAACTSCGRVESVQAIEVKGPGIARGCVVRSVDSKRLQQSVGSERLASGAAGGEAPPADDGRGSASSSGDYDDGYASSLAVPAPVVGDNEPSDAIDVDGDGDDGEDGNGNGDGGGGDGGPARAKKRRGRKRR